MSTAAAAINPISLGKDSIALLSKAAASDARHDFEKDFTDIFTIFKDIGASTDPPEVLIEHATLQDFFHPDTQRAIHPDRTKFDESIFEGEGQTKENIQLNPAFGGINKYTLKTKKFNALAKADDFFTFLDERKDSIYVQQDATSIGVKEKLEDSAAVTVGQKTFFLMASREGQNDAAGKTGEDDPIVKTTAGKKVKVAIQNEVKGADYGANKEVHYPRLAEIRTGQRLSVTNNFNSIFNIEISPIIYEEGKTKTKRVIMYFRDENNKLIGSTNKGKAENAKGNLASILKSFFKFFSSAKTKAKADKHAYWQSLQQKRGGDWLQALSTYDTKRFGLGDKENIILMTHDLIALAYALANGVSVLFTYAHPNKGAWILFFQNTATAEAKEIESYIKDIDNLKTLTSEQGGISQMTTNITSYNDNRNTLLATIKEKIIAAIDKVASLVINRDNIKDTINPLVREILEAFFDYSFFSGIFPDPKKFISPYYKEDNFTNTEDNKRDYGKFDTYIKKYCESYFEKLPAVINSFVGSTGTAEGEEKEKEKQQTTANGIIKAMNENLELTTLYKKFDWITRNLESNSTLSVDNKKLLKIKPTDAEKATLLEEIKELEKIAARFIEIRKTLESFMVSNTGGILTYNITSVKTNMKKKIKSKDVENINLFLKNLNPFVEKITINDDKSIKVESATSRFSDEAKPTGRLTNLVNMFKSRDDKSKNDYAVFNYFIGQQLDVMITRGNTEVNMKDSLVEAFDTILTKLTTLNDATQKESDKTTPTSVKNRVKNAKEQFENFVKEVKFYIKSENNLTYNNGLLSDLVKQLIGIVTITPTSGTSGGSVKLQRGGHSPRQLDFLKRLIELNAVKKNSININITEPIEKELKRDFGDYVALSNYWSEVKLEDRSTAINTIKASTTVASTTRFGESGEEAAAAEVVTSSVTSTTRTPVLLEGVKSSDDNDVDIESITQIETAFSNDESLEYEEVTTGTSSASAPASAPADASFVETTPASLYIDRIVAWREEGITKFNKRKKNSYFPFLVEYVYAFEEPELNDLHKRIKKMGWTNHNIRTMPIDDLITGILTTKKDYEKEEKKVSVPTSVAPELRKPTTTGRGGVSASNERRSQYGGAKLLGIPAGSNIPYLGWATLIFHLNTTLEILQDTNDVTEGFDFPYLARNAQFLIALQNVRERFNRTPTQGGRRTRKQRGAGGQGSPNLSGSTTSSSSGSSMTMTMPRKRTHFTHKELIERQQQSINTKLSKHVFDYLLGSDCDTMLTYTIPSLNDTNGQAVFAALRQGNNSHWLSSLASNINENYFNWGYDRSFESNLPTSLTLDLFMKAVLQDLSSQTPVPITNEGKAFIEQKVYETIVKVVEQMKQSEQGLLESIYKIILLNRVEANIPISGSMDIRSTTERETKILNERAKILELPYNTFENLQYLIKNRLLPSEEFGDLSKEIPERPLSPTFREKNPMNASIARNLIGVEKISPADISRVNAMLVADSSLMEEYQFLLKSMEEAKAAGITKEYVRLYDQAKAFYRRLIQSPKQGGRITRKKRAQRKTRTARLKSRSRTHNKI